MTAERDSMTLNEISYSALGVEERSDEAPRAGRARPTACEIPNWPGTSNVTSVGLSWCESNSISSYEPSRYRQQVDGTR